VLTLLPATRTHAVQLGWVGSAVLSRAGSHCLGHVDDDDDDDDSLTCACTAWFSHESGVHGVNLIRNDRPSSDTFDISHV